jgi:hypothetical protein
MTTPKPKNTDFEPNKYRNFGFNPVRDPGIPVLNALVVEEPFLLNFKMKD